LKQNFTQILCSFNSAISLLTKNRGSHITRKTINTRKEQHMIREIILN
jgi:hypothetical protein